MNDILSLDLDFFNLEPKTETETRSTDWLTDWLTDSLKYLHNSHRLKEGGKAYSSKILTRFQAASHLANAPSTTWEFSLEEYFANRNNNKPSTFIQDSGENPLLDEKKIDLHKIFSRGLTRAVLLFYWSSSSVIQICPF